MRSINATLAASSRVGLLPGFKHLARDAAAGGNLVSVRPPPFPDALAGYVPARGLRREPRGGFVGYEGFPTVFGAAAGAACRLAPPGVSAESSGGYRICPEPSRDDEAGEYGYDGRRPLSQVIVGSSRRLGGETTVPCPAGRRRRDFARPPGRDQQNDRAYLPCPLHVVTEPLSKIGRHTGDRST